MPTSKNKLQNETLLSSEGICAQNYPDDDKKEEVESENGYVFFDVDSDGDTKDSDEKTPIQCPTTYDDSNLVIDLDATLNIQNVVKLYARLKIYYLENITIKINASQVKSIDTATLQLLFALRKDAIKNQKQVIFINPSLKFIESARLLGLLHELGIQA